MSYQPPSEPQSEGTPTTNVSGGSGGYTPQPPQGGYTPPPSGGYAPPPPGGGYNAPPPPPGGGYNAPPPPPTGMGGGMPPMSAGGGQFNFQDLIQSWMGAVTRPSAQFYEGEIPKSNIMSLLVGLGVVIVVDIIAGILNSGAAVASLNSISNQTGTDYTRYAGLASGGSGFLSIIFVPLFFFLGAALIYGIAKAFGGQGTDFMTHAYLLSLSYVPLGVVSGLLGIIPGIGGIIGLLVLLYRQYSQARSLEASQRLAPNRAMMTTFLPYVIGIVLACLCIVIFVAGILGVASTSK